ncbi:hypothetical protein PR003_g20425 [Phytophthora rubi]|uniref:Uncharacterized protein n=1 Tax=Phytophthora rubi TaxID=129364 RepID=A0A6A4DN85_9STRA|nr:hypothetical protein PR003_g20425 [Phytophthora rubi]
MASCSVSLLSAVITTLARRMGGPSSLQVFDCPRVLGRHLLAGTAPRRVELDTACRGSKRPRRSCSP